MNTQESTSRDLLTPIAVAVAACLATVAVGLVVFGGRASGGRSADTSGSAVEATAPVATPEQPVGHDITYTWSSEVPAELGLALDQAAFEAYYPVFASETVNSEAIEAINADAVDQLAGAVDYYNNFAAWKSWGSVSLLPAVTLISDEYLAVHYYHWYNAGTTGTLSVAGVGRLYRLSDGAAASPAEMLDISEDELLARAQAAFDRSKLANSYSYEGTLAEMLAGGYLAGYVVLPDGVYVYVCGAARHRPDLVYHLVKVCDITGGDEGFDGMIIDLAAESSYIRYHGVARESVHHKEDYTVPYDVVPGDVETPLSGFSEAEQEELRRDAEARGLQVFEGTIRMMGGEETAALAGLDVYVNGDYAAELALNTSYAFLLLDDITTVNVTSDPDDGPQPQEANRFFLGEVLIGGEGQDGTEPYQPYSGLHVCVAAGDFWRGDDLNIIQAPGPQEFEILYVID